MGEHLAVKVIWQRYHSRRKLATPIICVTAKNNNHIRKAKILIDGHGDKTSYQTVATVYDINKKRVYSALPSLPFRDLTFENGFVFTPYKRIKITLLEAISNDGTIIDCSAISAIYISPSDHLENYFSGAKDYIEKWGEVFNLEYIHSLIRAEQRLLIGSRYNSIPLIYIIREKLFSQMLLVKIVFWSKNLILGKQIEKELTHYLERNNHELEIQKESLSN